MITRIIKIRLKPECRQEFIEFMPEFVGEVKKFSNIQHIDFFEDKESPNNYHIYTIWNTIGSLSKFRKSELNIGFKDKITHWSEKPYSAWTVENVFNQ